MMDEREIPEDEINAMCLTWRHDFGLPYSEQDAFVYGTTGPTPGEKMALQQQMRQLYRHHVLPAIMAERERCANIAEEHQVATAGKPSDYTNGFNSAALIIATAIRAPSP